MDRIAIQSTSARSATCSDILLRGGQRVRLIFRPELVKNDAEPAACVKGRFLYQRKGDRDIWSDVETQPLSTLKKGDTYQLELHSGELLALLKELGGLYRLVQKRGLPQGRIELVKMGQQLAKLLQLSESDLETFLGQNSDDAVKTLRKVMAWLSTNPVATQRFAEDDSQLPELNALVGLTNLRAALNVWETNRDNDDEEFWQGVFTRHAFVLSQLLAYPVVIIRGKAYVGGKRVDNAHGNLVDFLGRVNTSGAAVLIEIKKPTTELLERKEYRQDVFGLSRELTGAISQVLQYRESLMLDMQSILQDQATGLTACEPKCIIIAGSAERELTSDSARRSFERFRGHLSGITLLTYDEVFERVAGLMSLFTDPQGS